ncbi:unnamed protein product, partial [Timema podura]|nr:unnamed protein product [Timema podura]
FQVKDKHGISALLAAIWEGHTSCVKLLLEHVERFEPIFPERHQIALTDDPERYQLTARLTDLDKLRGRDSSQEHAESLLFSELPIDPYERIARPMSIHLIWFLNNHETATMVLFFTLRLVHHVIGYPSEICMCLSRYLQSQHKTSL